jgi:diguanylate cyclase (GGDEF)-like protein/PAS domain S-box-containing protein
MYHDHNEKYQQLRQRAEQLLESDPERFAAPGQADVAGLLHELAVFQAELEMQNDELRHAQQQAEEVRDQYASLYNQAPVGYLRLNEFGMILHHNKTFAEMIKSEHKPLINKPLVKLLAPEDRDIFYARFNAFFHNPTGKNIEVRFTLPLGATLVTSLSARRDLHCITTNELHPTLLVIVSDITEICNTRRALEQARTEAEGTCDQHKVLLRETRKLSRLYLVLSRINQLIVRHPQQNELFQGACDIAVQSGGFYAAWIGLKNELNDITPVTSSGMELQQLTSLGIRTCGPRGRGPSGSALQSGRTSVINNLQESGVVSPWRDFITSHTLGSVAALPVMMQGGHNACFVLYSHDQNFFDEAEIRLLEEMALNIGHALEVADMDREQEQTRNELSFLARHDPLTGLANRLMFSNYLSLALERVSRNNGMLALLLLDLDRFKDVNDSFGHPVGDQLLVQVAQRLTGRLRGEDSISRLGGDEFTVVLEGVQDPQDAAWVANDLIELLRKPFQLGDAGELSIGTSIGIALYPDHGSNEQELLQQADAALYRAKEEGRDRFKFFSEELTREARERIQLAARLRKALELNELELYYQPQLDLYTGKLVGAEALIRWNHPEFGIVQPSQFIPLAEQTGLINLLGEWVIREACSQGSRWLAEGIPMIRLAVNLSPLQLQHGCIASSITAILAETGFPAELLEIEVTESALMQYEAKAAEILQRISNLGVRLALDDFGTGYSSLARLKQFPLTILKIDRSFVTDIMNNQTDREIAATIIAMGHTLGFKVLAEGVEEQEQLDLLKSLQCDLFQGFLVSKPIPAEDFSCLAHNLYK